MKIYRIKESKTSQLKKLLSNGNITEEQFKIADEFFKKYNSFENEIDWNKGNKITWEDLESVIYKNRSSKSQTKKKIRKGLEGFEEEKDYLVLAEGVYNNKPWVAYQPFTWEASRMIASHYVEPSESNEGEIEDAGWCTAYQKDRDFWDMHNDREAFIYICGETIPSKKVAISISKEERDASGSKFLYYVLDYNLNFNIWDFWDDNDTIEKKELLIAIPDFYQLIDKAYQNWRKHIAKSFKSKYLIFNPKTKRYDSNIGLSKRDLQYFVAPDNQGFSIDFGDIRGPFLCNNLHLLSLKGAPQSVGSDFDCSNNKLTSLEGAPTKVGRDFLCDQNLLVTLKGCPRRVEGDFNCYDNKLSTLEYSPDFVMGDFDCSNNELISLEGAPQQGVGGSFFCFYNQLTSLKGAPPKVGGGFHCSDNDLTSLEGAPEIVMGLFFCRRNPQLKSLDGLGTVGGRIFTDFNNGI